MVCVYETQNQVDGDGEIYVGAHLEVNKSSRLWMGKRERELIVKSQKIEFKRLGTYLRMKWKKVLSSDRTEN